ncbi:MAG: SAM-dependent methyltransferase [Steroidobacteraceae bacterium]|jgi:SAM-dependent MidA family methyltransferase
MSFEAPPGASGGALGEEALEHAARMRERLAGEIRAAGGWIGFDRYMETALYAPGLGYYSAGARKLGPGGDFTTAPQISHLFGACLARQCAQVLESLQGGSILEIGAGTGTLAADILARLESLGQLPAQYLILDVSADLRGRQRRTLEERVPHLAARVEWLDSAPASQLDGVILANEVLDALPVTRFRWFATHCEELGVSIERDRFVWSPRPADTGLAQICRSLAQPGWEDGYVSEYCARLPAWALEVTRGLRRGLALWIDYGLPRRQYYLPERRDGTLMCHFRQRAHDDPFFEPGLQDITAWVDFTLLAEASSAGGFTLAGFCTQSYLLAALGVDREMGHLAAGDEHRFARLANEARRLMMPGEMGERFKAMAWLRNLDLPLSGFSLQDLRHTL